MGMDSKNSSDKKWLPLKLGDGKNDKKKNKLLFLVVAAVIGAALMAASDMWNKKNQAVTTTVQPPSQKDVETFATDKKTKPKNIQDYETQYENQLKEALDEMLGVNNVTVVVNVEATEKKYWKKTRKPKSKRRKKRINKEGKEPFKMKQKKKTW